MSKLKMVFVPLTLLSLLVALSCGGGNLRSSRMGGFGPFTSRVPYTSYVNYYGYVAPSLRPDGREGGKSAYYLYFWVPAAIDEVGVSMLSPTDSEPGSDDLQHPKYNIMKQVDPGAWFDTYLVLHRMTIVSSDKIKYGGRAIQELSRNDDSSEMPTNPAGRNYNSLLRVQTDTANPSKALVRGVYRITLTSYRGAIKGSYKATVGTNIPGVKIASTLAELHELVNAK